MTDLKVTANMNCFGNNVGLLCFKECTFMFQVIILDCGCNQMVIFQIHS